ncbi:YbjN domain-containing protein [Tumidithrix elongata RA019]|uniref:YbjN domain-containing protein n=1 Tax=Tumidithrix elongata BACA0141 TaxID=2716417 RepID=A0AAW9PYW4_9CYAN|nr:YbjN domain-containing protein [Tumidithrix elongata RA019]
MQFQTPAQEACYHKIAVWMREIFGKFPCARQDVPGLGIFMGSALVEVLVFPWNEDDAVINTRSYVVTGAEIKPDLMRFLLDENASMIFGGFGIDPNGDIVFEHSIVGSTCDRKELESSVKAVLEIADEYDDAIVEKWGGKRALDRLEYSGSLNGIHRNSSFN